MSRNVVSEFLRQMDKHHIKRITVETCTDTPGCNHVPSRIEEYSKEDGSIKKLSPELMEEICEGMSFRRCQVNIVRQVGGTLEVKVG